MEPDDVVKEPEAEDTTVEEVLTGKNHRYKQDVIRLTENRMALLVEYKRNGGNVSKAAEAVGLNPSYARRVAAQDPGFRRLLQVVDEAPVTRVIEWSKLVGKAQDTLIELLDGEDSRVKFMAAREILDRAEGKPTQKVDKREVKVQTQIDQDTMMNALRLLAAGAEESLASALLRAQKHPEEVQKWLSSGREIIQED